MKQFVATILLVCLGFVAALSALAEPPGDDEIENPAVFAVNPLSKAAELVEKRFEGKLIGARLVPPKPRESDLGIQLVQELRLLTPQRNVLVIRIDAETGKFLEVAGSGIAEARKPVGSRP